MTTPPAVDGQWPVVASTWRLIGPPLRPAREDLDIVNDAVAEWTEAATHPVRALILGVTPELYHLPWPDGAVVRAVDRTEQMIEEVWPGDRADVVVGDWAGMDWPPSSFDIVLCDGGWHLLTPDGQARLAATLAAAIAPRGRFITRLFTPPARPETPDAVIAALMSGQIPDLNCLKLRLGHALMDSASAGIELGHVWAFLRNECGDWVSLAEKLGWELEHLTAIDAYRGSAARYHFVTTEQFESTVCAPPTGFAIRSIHTPNYAMGTQCPTVVVEKSDG